MSSSASHQPGEAFIRALTESQTALRGYCQASLGNADEAKANQYHDAHPLDREALEAASK